VTPDQIIKEIRRIIREWDTGQLVAAEALDQIDRILGPGDDKDN